MIPQSLGRLESVQLREVWVHEATSFTPWLAQEENLALLGDTIGLDLELEQAEKFVGPFRADIVCRDTLSDTIILIENQIERTDHSHLGQLLTYAAGLNAVTIVWIAERFTDEHRATLDWLNEITAEEINFFGLEIELWRIGNSVAAPKFNIISQPNDWIKQNISGRRGAAESPSATKQLQYEYWQALVDHLKENRSFLKTRKPRPQHWMNFAVGHSDFRLTAYANTREKRIGVLHRGPIKVNYHVLYRDKAAIEEQLGPLDWRELPNKKSSIIMVDNRSFDPNLNSQWPAQHQWLQQTLEAFYRVFNPRIRQLSVTDFDEEAELDDALLIQQ